MLTFMDYLREVFFKTTEWNTDNSYKTLSATANDILHFPIPEKLHISLSSLSSPHFANSYTFNAFGPVRGHIAYLYTSRPLRDVVTSSAQIDLANLVRGYRDPSPLNKPDEPAWWHVWHRGKRVDRRDYLLFGRLHIPESRLEALYLRRLSPTKQLELRAVTDSALPTGGSVLAVVQTDEAKYSTEYLFSTDGGFLGLAGLYNFGPDPRHTKLEGGDRAGTAAVAPPPTKPPSRLSVGAEVYYGLLNKTGGMSTGLRFSTLPPYSTEMSPQSQSQSQPVPTAHATFPYTMTLTLNPLFGNLCTTYSVKAGELVSLSSQFDFNFYSYESGVILGAEIWRRHRDSCSPSPPSPSSSSSSSLSPSSSSAASTTEPSPHAIGPDPEPAFRPDRPPLRTTTTTEEPPTTVSPTDPPPPPSPSSSLSPTQPDPNPGPQPDPDSISSVLKARIDQDLQLRVVYQRRYRHILVSAGAVLDLRAPFCPSPGVVAAAAQADGLVAEGDRGSGPSVGASDGGVAGSGSGSDRPSSHLHHHHHHHHHQHSYQQHRPHSRDIVHPRTVSTSSPTISAPVSGPGLTPVSGPIPVPVPTPAPVLAVGKVGPGPPFSRPVGSFVAGLGFHVSFSA